MPYRDPEDKRRHNQEYAGENRKSIAERKARWYQENKERLTEKKRLDRRAIAKQDAAALIQNLINKKNDE